MPDYSEFPTTPTAWQEHAWGEVTPLETEDPPSPARRGVDLTALVPGLVFVVLAVVVAAGAVLPLGVVDGGLLWLVLVAGGVALLVSELRRARRRR
ncbi:hypothetical protein SAMN06893096_101243 [Geodermatophilus pulveris]|uniref:Uncharacterized protein n=1 Tax=Geodermatophilus pulveris TaxID=1564159 RepID=A0A239AWK6_9ACTN|nr:hypothetical protein [Geodermatophilus pulveris]SNR99333.1 hypothetical protein SAMN06893096_101243 [Geodermatophilus pulveris]